MYGVLGKPVTFTNRRRRVTVVRLRYEKGGSNVQLTRVLPAVSVLSLIGVEYGGWALLGFLTGRGQLGQFRE
jgi:hypothetical protein